MTDCPRMKAKLQLLYNAGLNPAIGNHSALARALRVSRQSVSQWLNGSHGHRIDAVPHSKLLLIAAFFSLESQWFTEPLDAFEFKLRRLSATRERAPKHDVAGSLSFALGDPPPLIGRASALAALNFAWFTASIHAVSVEGCVGSGKTALMSHWLQQLTAKGNLEAERTFVWDFDASVGSAAVSETRFLSALCEFLGMEAECFSRSSDCVRGLGEHFSRATLLFILDGLDRVLPTEAASDVLETPLLNAVIGELFTANSGLLVVSTRTPLRIFSAGRHGGTMRVPLGNLTHNEALGLLRERGVTCDSRIQREVVEQTAGHALSLCHAARWLQDYGDARGFFFPLERLLCGSWLSDDLHTSPSILPQRYSDQESAELLALLSLLDAPVSTSELEGLVTTLEDGGLLRALTASLVPVLSARLRRDNLLTASVDTVSGDHRLPGVNEPALSEVRDGGVPSQPLIHMQPLLRVQLSAAMKTDNEQTFRCWHRHIAQHFLRLDSAPYSGSGTVSVLRSVRHSVAAGLVAEAAHRFFLEQKPGVRASGADCRQHERQTLAVFFGRSWMEPNPIVDERVQQQLQMAAAQNLMALGFTKESSLVARHCIEFLLRSEHRTEALGIAVPLATQFLALGQLQHAENLLKDLRVGPGRHEASPLHPALESSVISIHATTAFVRGEFDAAEAYFAASERLLHGLCSQPAAFATLSAHYCRFLIATGRAEQAIERGLETLAWRAQQSWQTRIDSPALRASDLMMVGLGYVAVGDLAAAEGYIDEQLAVLRASNEWLYLPTGLNARAQFYSAAGERGAAVADLHEGLALTEVCRARASRWELLLSFAEHHAQARNYGYARAFLEQAQAIEGLEEFRYNDGRIEKLVTLIIQGGGSG